MTAAVPDRPAPDERTLAQYRTCPVCSTQWTGDVERCPKCQDAYDAAWTAILGDDELSHARSVLSIHELRILIRHAVCAAPSHPPEQEPVAWRIRWAPDRTTPWFDMVAQPPTDTDRLAYGSHGAFEYAYAAPVAQPPAEDITYWRKRALQAEQSASEHLAELESEPPAEWVERAMLLAKHYGDARVNHSSLRTRVQRRIALEAYAALRAHLTAGGGR